MTFGGPSNQLLGSLAQPLDDISLYVILNLCANSKLSSMIRSVLRIPLSIMVALRTLMVLFTVQSKHDEQQTMTIPQQIPPHDQCAEMCPLC